MINPDILKSVDKSDMFSVLREFPSQVEDALKIGDNAKPMPEPIQGDIFVLGMGGSAIGGDLISSYFSSVEGLNKFHITTNRDYQIPGTLSTLTSVIASSYSGGTEETLEGLQSAYERTKNISCITTGGKLGEMADKFNLPKVIIPTGYMPRCALGYSFFPMLKLISKSINASLALNNKLDYDVDSTLAQLKKLSAEYSSLSEDNHAIKIASSLKGRIPVIYSTNSLNSVNLRWRCQIQENAKQLCWGHVLPEMNHNEINSWTHPVDFTKNFVIITLEDMDEHPKVKLRFEAIRKLLSSNVAEIISLAGEGDNFLTRMFSLTYLGDWVSYYLSILNGEDPTPIPLISKLKNILSGGA